MSSDSLLSLALAATAGGDPPPKPKASAVATLSKEGRAPARPATPPAASRPAESISAGPQRTTPSPPPRAPSPRASTTTPSSAAPAAIAPSSSSSSSAAAAGATGAGATGAGGAASTGAGSSSTGGAPITPLVHPKTITITFVPDWTQDEMQSPHRPVTVSVVLGPAGTLPQHSQFCFEFLLYSDGTSSPVTGQSAAEAASRAPGGEAFSIPKGERALLWHVNAPYPRFEHAVVRSGCRMSSGDELKTVSVAMRTHSDEKHPNALVYVRRNGKITKSDSNTGYLKVVKRHHYYLNITFATSSTIAQLVGLYAWRPMIYISSKKIDPTTGRDTVTGSRVFTHFNTNWAQGVEHNPSEGEQKAAAEAIAADTKVEETLRVQSKQRQTNLTPGSTGHALFSPTPSASIVPLHPLALPLSSAGSTGSGLALHTGLSAAPQPQQQLSAGHLAYAPPSFVGTTAVSPFPPAPPVPMPAGMISLPGHPPPSNMALAQSMMAQLSVSATPTQAQQHQHEVLRAQHQQQQAQLLTQYQLQYQNQQRALQQYQQLQSHQLSLPSTQQQQLQVQTAHRPTLTQQQLALLAQPRAHDIASSQLALPALVPGTQALQLSAISANPAQLHFSDAYRYQLLQQQSAMLQLTTTGQQKTQAYQHAMAPIDAISGNGMTTAVLNSLLPNPNAAPAVDVKSQVPVKPVADFEELEAEIKSKPLHSVNLPALDEKSQCVSSNEVSFDPLVSSFSQSSVMAKALAAIEFEARVLSLDSKHEASDAARHMLSCLSAVNQLVGWQHVSWYIRDAAAYLEKCKDTQKLVSASAFGGTIIAGSMDDYQQRGQALIKRLAQRVEWLLSLQRRANRPFDASFAVKVIAADRLWAHDANLFMREAESKVTELLVSNQSKFQEFREQQRKGVSWPHSAELRKTIEAAGFVYRPMMIKRDRCVCETCGVEVSGWRPWHSPLTFHNHSRHDVTSRPPQHLLASADPAAIAAAVTEINLRGNQTASAGTSALGSSVGARPAAGEAAATAASAPAVSTRASAAAAAMGDGGDS